MNIQPFEEGSNTYESFINNNIYNEPISVTDSGIIETIIKMKESIIISMKDVSINNDDTNDDIVELDELSDKLIIFMKKFTKQKQKMDDAEVQMNKCIQQTEKDIEIFTTFIHFLTKVNNNYDKDITSLEGPIQDMCKSIKDNNNIKKYKDEYNKEKTIFLKQLRLLKLVNQMNVGSTCSICLQENVDSYFNPCGHTGCHKCCDKYLKLSNDNKKCPLCRTQVYNINKLYFN